MGKKKRGAEILISFRKNLIKECFSPGGGFRERRAKKGASEL